MYTRPTTPWDTAFTVLGIMSLVFNAIAIVALLIFVAGALL